MSKMAHRVFLIYPPGGLFQRGEDRCQSNVEASTATTMREPTDLATIAASCKKRGWDVFVRDYQTEGATLESLETDLRDAPPTAIFLSTTNATIYDDLKLIRHLKPLLGEAVVLMKGAIFFNAPDSLLDELDLTDVDYLIGGECEFITDSILAAHTAADRSELLDQLGGVIYRNEAGRWVRTPFDRWSVNLDDAPLPDRSVIQSRLYCRPDTGRPMATIVAARGCPSACIFCQTPLISGQRLRQRSYQSILAELRNCYHEHGICDFFFRADTFTFDPVWVEQLCNAICESEMAGKISWAANSRVRPLKLETLVQMKRAGCWLVAFGFESGHPDSLAKMKKGVTLDENRQAARWAKQAGLKCYGFYLVGFPWETEEHLAATRELMFANNTDFVELHLAMPFYGTPMYTMAQEAGLLEGTTLGEDYFSAPAVGTQFLSQEQLQAFQKKALLAYHLRIRYIGSKLAGAMLHPRVLWNYARFGGRLIMNCLRK
jgi:anaerobic magnesium-protoporphyrin IX monomethyl ester cyclase